MIPRAADHLFSMIERGGSLQNSKFLVRVSFLQLYRGALRPARARAWPCTRSPSATKLRTAASSSRASPSSHGAQPRRGWALAAKGQRSRRTVGDAAKRRLFARTRRVHRRRRAARPNVVAAEARTARTPTMVVVVVAAEEANGAQTLTVESRRLGRL